MVQSPRICYERNPRRGAFARTPRCPGGILVLRQVLTNRLLLTTHDVMEGYSRWKATLSICTSTQVMERINRALQAQTGLFDLSSGSQNRVTCWVMYVPA